jgi:hypothetical protein
VKQPSVLMLPTSNVDGVQTLDSSDMVYCAYGMQLPTVGTPLVGSTDRYTPFLVDTPFVISTDRYNYRPTATRYFSSTRPFLVNTPFLVSTNHDRPLRLFSLTRLFLPTRLFCWSKRLLSFQPTATITDQPVHAFSC